jgi:molecular chaperone GrpE (heat shock protein)
MTRSEDLENLKRRKKKQQQKAKNNSEVQPLSSESSTTSQNVQETTTSIKQDSELEIRLESMQKEMEDWKQKAFREAADLQNFQKQAQLDSQQSTKHGKKQVIKALLPFLTALNLAFAFAPKTEDEKVIKFIETLQASFQQVTNDLSQQNVELIVPIAGQLFNPEIMDALNAHTGSEPTIQYVVTVGVKIDNQVIQPATVMVV